MARLLMALIGLLLVGGLALLALGQLGLLKGKPPGNLGVRDGRLKPPSDTENSVSSQADMYPALVTRSYARIEPLVVAPKPATAASPIARIRDVVQTLEGADVIEARDDYLYVQFTTRWLKFVDDAEFWLDPATQTVQVRSASRLGGKDFGVNRARIEVIRRLLAAP